MNWATISDPITPTGAVGRAVRLTIVTRRKGAAPTTDTASGHIRLLPRCIGGSSTSSSGMENVALIPNINGSGCYTTCDEFSTSCQYYGCTDQQVMIGSCSRRRLLHDGRPLRGVRWRRDELRGCTDVACNYDAFNIVDDGGCFYSPNGGACDCEAVMSLADTLAVKPFQWQ